MILIGKFPINLILELSGAALILSVKANMLYVPARIGLNMYFAGLVFDPTKGAGEIVIVSPAKGISCLRLISNNPINEEGIKFIYRIETVESVFSGGLSCKMMMFFELSSSVS